MAEKIEQDVLDRLLLAKALLGGVRFTPGSRPDGHTTAHDILIAQDAVELALAGIARHLGCLPARERAYLMDYVEAIETKTKEAIPFHGFFSDLNLWRRNIKHHGQKPDVAQWHQVGVTAHERLSSICEKYLGMPLDAIDDSVLIQHEEVRQLLEQAKAAYRRREYRVVLEKLGHALFVVFRDSDNPGLRSIGVGEASAESAIKLAAFGVNANEFLTLQEFLPKVRKSDGQITYKWNQEEHGHPANWSEDVATFCLGAFVHVAVRVQGAPWTPSAIPFMYVYEQKITALEDGVEITREEGGGLFSPSLSSLLSSTPPSPKRVVVRRLAKGESVVGMVHKKASGGPLARFGKPPSTDQEWELLTFIEPGPKGIWGDVDASKVRITCVPRDFDFVRQHYPWLPEIDWQPS